MSFFSEKHFTEHNDIFADLVNMAYFAGIEFIKPESLTDRPARQLVIRKDELGDKNFKNVYNSMISEGKEPKTMCEMIDKITKKAKAEGKAEGLAEGEAKGIMQKAIETAKVAISMGLPVAQIMALTNLPEKNILQLM